MAGLKETINHSIEIRKYLLDGERSLREASVLVREFIKIANGGKYGMYSEGA